MIKAVLFDLDGTLLPMDQEVFLKAYFGGLVKTMLPHGYDPQQVIQSIWDGTRAMVANDGSRTNEEVFWERFCNHFGPDARKDEPVFDNFYRTEFQKVQQACGFAPQALEAIELLHARGIRTILATNPVFPPIATQSRIRWAGLKPEDFEWVTTYDNSGHCKPNPDYYREILAKRELAPEECIMVGNDVGEDMIARELGMQVFLLTPCLINKPNADISQYPNGGFPELLEFLRGL